MSKYQELVKSFDNIRKISHDFFIYGYNGRGDFPFISERMYDNELRRVKSYLKDYVKTTQTKDKKTISISSNTIHEHVNPLFPLFLGKSFTNIDCFLHFALLAILNDNNKRTLNEIALEIVEQFKYDELDIMTIRNKLHEYSELGIVIIEKDKNRNLYSLKKPVFLDENLQEAITFFQNIMPAGYIMTPIIDNNNSLYYYKQIFFANVLDDEYVLSLFKAIQNKEMVTIEQRGRKHQLTKSGIPVGIFYNMITGRRYLKLLLKNHNEVLVRIDKIDKVSITKEETQIVSVEEEKKQFIDITVLIEDDELFVLERIKREIGEETLQKIGENLYTFRLYATELLDLVPYIRSYFGRIVDLESENKYVISKLKRDLFSTLDLYKEGERYVS